MVSLEGFLRGFRAKNRGLTIDIDKIGYGTDGKRVVRVITGFDKQKSLNDIFEISEDFFASEKTMCCLK